MEEPWDCIVVGAGAAGTPGLDCPPCSAVSPEVYPKAPSHEFALRCLPTNSPKRLGLTA